MWRTPLSTKLHTGDTQRISRVQFEENNYLILTLGAGESRYRAGDLVRLHAGDAAASVLVQQASIEAEYENQWLLRTSHQDLTALKSHSGDLYADLDGMDLTAFYDQALNEIAASRIGVNIILPLLAGTLDAAAICTDAYDEAADHAEAQGLNEAQIDAVGKGVAAEYLACIQGPPGTGKTKVISSIAQRLIAEGQSVLLTSHTHMAINNALNKIAEQTTVIAKVGPSASAKGLDSRVKCVPRGDAWEERPDNGYVIGATPFATCNHRLEDFEFHTVIFDEASQVTVPLALMAMRKAERFVFVGDHKQLPPVVLSKSVLHSEAYSAFSALISGNPDTLSMLTTTYRMNRRIAAWPNDTYYAGQLNCASQNADRTLSLPHQPAKYQNLLAPAQTFVFIQGPGTTARTHNDDEAALVVDIIGTAVDAGLPPGEIGVVTPYRSHANRLRKRLIERLGADRSHQLVVDTVERMQGQEREMMFISLCTTDSRFLTQVASFFFQSERLNVAVTRAKTKLVLLGPRLASGFTTEMLAEGLRQKVDDYRSLVSTAQDVTTEAYQCFGIGEALG